MCKKKVIGPKPNPPVVKQVWRAIPKPPVTVRCPDRNLLEQGVLHQLKLTLRLSLRVQVYLVVRSSWKGDRRTQLELVMNNIGSWNVRGINGANKQQDVKKFLYHNNIGLYGLVETKVKEHGFLTILHNLELHWEGINNNNLHNGGRVWVIWDPQIFRVALLHKTTQAITVSVTEIDTGDSFKFTVVYGSNDDEERNELWEHLREMHCREVTWADIANFRSCVTYCGLTDIKGQGAFFTWNNKQVPASRGFSRIDRFMVNSAWLDLYPDGYAHFLPERLFDHNPCVCYRRLARMRRKNQFKYYNMWSLDPEFKNVVMDSWNQNILGTPMYILVSKLKKLKAPLKSLNRNGFSDVDKATGIARSLLEEIQLQLHNNPGDHVLSNAEREAAATYRHLCKVQYTFLSQKVKVDWLKFGDENTRYFHSQIRYRQVHNRVISITGGDGIRYSTCDGIENAFLDYYKSLLGTSLPTMPVHVPTVRIGRVITEEHKNILMAPMTAAEIKECLFSIPSTKSPGPDGYSSQFFKDSWDVVGNDVIVAIQDFFTNGKMLKQTNTTTLTLIPKTANPVSVLDFRPIVCCNTIYKTVTKVICKRLSKVLPDIVSDSQGGFIKGRNIVENVLICQDLVRLYNRKAASPHCLIKIDLKKAYDSVEWLFLEKMMGALQFPQKFIDMVMVCVSSPSYSLNVNGNHFGLFPGKRGLRQGDPLSPLLFTLCMEYLSRILGVVAQQDSFKFHPLCAPLKLNHLLFADDLLLFCKGTDVSIMWMLRAFSTFSAASGLTHNKTKSEIYFNGVPTSTIDPILQVSVLNTLHSYWASIFLIPSNIMNKITSICRNYLWSGSSEFKKVPNISWSTCCLPKDEGGLGIKEAKVWNKALLGKYVWWLANKKDHLWVKRVSNIYMKGSAWTAYKPPVDCSWSWKKLTHIMETFKQAYTKNKWLNTPAEYTVYAGYDWLRDKEPAIDWKYVCWNLLNIPKCSFIFWEFMHHKLPTKDKLTRMGLTIDQSCDLCASQPETMIHVFYECEYGKLCTRLLQQALHCNFRLQDLIVWYSKGRGTTKLQRNYKDLISRGMWHRPFDMIDYDHSDH
ncbi:uncharacterized protein LOC141590534 [Silene latifolia]|uniref:uncharacterized protein LOC141590534 n=1 Tax=Silene latifolia TaxID=37657 RepID=UPI003D775600